MHHLDLDLGAPSQRGLGEVRRVLDGLLGRPAPIADEKRYAMIGTGRMSLNKDEQTLLGADAAAFRCSDEEPLARRAPVRCRARENVP